MPGMRRSIGLGFTLTYVQANAPFRVALAERRVHFLLSSPAGLHPPSSQFSSRGRSRSLASLLQCFLNCACSHVLRVRRTIGHIQLERSEAGAVATRAGFCRSVPRHKPEGLTRP
ncbi:hypothetical protein B0H13DRAFT_2351060 [Mycena leptocephala]|nr:hypothetical protein B0H13DRAFT_2351060 [Mycena leptocephala]